jgi:AcrR family transcriptional regulator
MSETVKSPGDNPDDTPRKYDATRRQDQARRSRTAVLAAARERFLTEGFRATTIADVATAAGVSTQQIYKIFGTKAGLVKALFDVAIAGDDEPTAMVEREALRRVREEPDPYLKLRLYGDFVADTAPRHVPIQLLVRAAADTDPDAATLWESLGRERLHGMTMFARDLSPDLRSDVTVDDARDILWSSNSPELWDLLVNQRGWTPGRFAAHLAGLLTRSLLPATNEH